MFPIKVKFLFCLVCFTLILQQGNAIPAIKKPITLTQPDGTQLTILIHGSEFFSYRTTTDGFVIEEKEDGFFYYVEPAGNETIRLSTFKANNTENRTTNEKKYLQTLPKEGIIRTLQEKANTEINFRTNPIKPAFRAGMDFPLEDEPRVLVILVEFSDMPFTVPNPQDAFYRMLNEEGYSEYNATGSARDYFIENSSGKFRPQFDVYGPVTLPQSYTYYGRYISSSTVDYAPAEMVVDACKAIADEVDFSIYDTDGDREVDNVYIFYAGYSQAETGAGDDIWPHAWYLSSAGERLRIDGVRIDRYACSNELRASDNLICGIGTFVHEFSHVLGLPDLYATDYSNSFTPGDWSMLDHGPYNNNGRTPPYMSAYERYCLGWLEPVELDTIPAIIELEDISNNVGYIIKTQNENEYYILENRQQQGWDTYIPGHGMLVWHIDYQPWRWLYNMVNNNPDHQCVDLVEADNIKTAKTRDGDSFPGTSNVTSFTDDTTPSMITWDGIRLNKPITGIKEKVGIISFYYIKDEKTSLSVSEAEQLPLRIFMQNDILNILPEESGIQDIEIFNSYGRLLLKDRFENSLQIPTGNLPTGIYLIRIKNHTFKIVI